MCEKFKYLLFDLDGTLTDPKLGITGCVQYALRKFGIDEPDLDKLEPFIGPPLPDSLREFYGFDEQQIAEAVVYYRERFSTIGLFENEIYPGIEEMLAHLKQAGKKLAIASSKPTVFVERILRHFNIWQYFDVIIGSELDGTRSKKEDVVEEALRQLCELYAPDKVRSLHNVKASQKEQTLQKEQTPQKVQTLQKEQTLQKQNIGIKSDYDTFVMIGDRKFDINAAKAFGIVSVGCSFGYAAPGELEQAGADYIVDTVQQLEELLMG